MGLTPNNTIVQHTFLLLLLFFKTNKATIIIIIATKTPMLPETASVITVENYLK